MYLAMGALEIVVDKAAVVMLQCGRDEAELIHKRESPTAFATTPSGQN